MKNGFKDYRRILFYTILGIGMGIVIGTVDTLFGRVLRAITSFREEHVLMLVPFLPIAGIFTLWLFEKISPESQKGMTLIFETGVEKNERIPKALIPLIMITTWMTHLFGGSAGRVGITMQVGATSSHTMGKILKRKEDEKIFLIIGIAAGFAGLFQTPLAATFFAMEFLVVGAMFYEALLPAVAAAYAASYTSHLLGFQKFSIVFSNNLSYNYKRKVWLRIKPVKSQILLEVSNTFEGETCKISKITGLPISERGAGHGFGMKSVRAYVNKYHGIFQYSVENQKFCVRLLTEI